MPITFTQDEWKIRSLDVVHINPSILEGQFAHDSLYGKRSAELLIRYAPINLVPPSISGDFKIPSTLTCNPGVWDAAPTADYLYQWRANGVDIPGETGQTWTSDISFDAMSIDCVVTAVNVIGFDTLPSSNQIVVEIVEPIEVREQDYYSITGLQQYQQQNMNVFREMVITGIAVEDQVTMFENKMAVISGLAIADTQTMFDLNEYVITGLGQDQALMAHDTDLYVLQIPEYLDSATIQNPDAEQGMAFWNQVADQNVVTTTNSPYAGTAHFYGGDATVVSGMEQTVDVPATIVTEVDNGNVLAILSWVQGSHENDDQVKASMTFLDGSDALIGSYNHGNRARASWSQMNTPDALMPVGTRKVVIRFDFFRVTGSNNNGYVDNIALDFWEQIGSAVAGPPPVFTDPHYGSVTNLLRFEGADGQTSFTNDALFGRNPYITSGSPEISAANALLAGSTGSLQVNEVSNPNDKLGIGWPQDAGTDFGTGDFTIEGFAQAVASSNTYWHSVIGNYNNADPGSWGVMRRDNNDGGVLIFLVDDNASVQGTTNVNESHGTFHFAISRNGDTIRLFVNGVMEGKLTGYAAVNVGGTQPVRVGGNNASSNDNWRGFIDNIRVTKGVGRYDSDASFTVPTTLYAL